MRASSLTTLLVFQVMVAVASAQASSLELDGSPSRLEVSPDAALSPRDGVTVEAWVWSEPGNTSQATIVRQLANETYNLRERFGRIEFVVRTETTGLTIHAAPVGIPAQQWTHVAGTFDGQTARIYRDGIEVFSQAKFGPLATAPSVIRLGSGNGSGNEYWIGRIDEIRIWDRARTAQEIQATQFAQLVSRPNLIGSWNFNGGTYQDARNRFQTQVFGTPQFSPSIPPISGLVTSPALVPFGATITFDLMSLQPNQPYLFDISVTGTTPGIPLDPTLPPLPLNPPLLNLEFGYLVPGTFEGFLGFFDAANMATARVHLPADPALAGVAIAGAFVTFDPRLPTFFDEVSEASVTRITGDPPTFTGLAPSTGLATGGTNVTLTGTNFQPGMTLTLGGSVVTPVNVVNAMTATFQTPAGTVGAADLQIENPDGNVLSVTGAFTYIAPLMVTAVDPVQVVPGQLVRVLGAGFQQGLTIDLAGVTIIPTSVATGEVRFLAPASIPCDSTLTVDNPDGQSATAMLNTSPTVVRAISATGSVAGGAVFFVVGTGFGPGTIVTVGGQVATINSVSPTVVSAFAPPASAPGPQPIIVSTAVGCSSGSVDYVYQ